MVKFPNVVKSNNHYRNIVISSSDAKSNNDYYGNHNNGTAEAGRRNNPEILLFRSISIIPSYTIVNLNQKHKLFFFNRAAHSE